ncbi:hypothetical protein BGZ63DRAFT_403710 [Mariannaea sp. PMI_226]|nr:hypothetical protein BGZ63DRAFT_403710 [Mariannaea sp. PMI_226]
MPSTKLAGLIPWAKAPLIISAPMAGVSSPRLAMEVTKAGGFGFLGANVNISAGSPELDALDTAFTQARAEFSDLPANKPIPIGTAFLTGHESMSEFNKTALPILAKHNPAAVWLFSQNPELNLHTAMIKAVKALDPAPVVFVQVGNLATAREAIKDGADVLVAQGIDGGGHQFRRGAGIVTLVPEIRNLLENEYPNHDIGLVAAGGISEGRGVVAALALGAEAVVLGTRFTVATESNYPQKRKDTILKAVDGASSTLKYFKTQRTSPFNDDINRSKLWHPPYDGRAVISPIHEDFIAGASLEECLEKLDTKYTKEEATNFTMTWAGTGVGLVNKAQPAAEIVRELHEEAKAAAKKLSSRF